MGFCHVFSRGNLRVHLATQTQILTIQATSESVRPFSDNDGEAEDDTHSER